MEKTLESESINLRKEVEKLKTTNSKIKSKIANQFHKIYSPYLRWKKFKLSIKKQSFQKHFILETVESILIALVLALLVRQFALQTSIVPTGSMIPTLEINDRLFVNKMVYYYKKPSRGDIVVFKSPNGDNKDYVKRCIGMPGDTLSVKSGHVFINGKLLVIAGVDIQIDKSDHNTLEIPKGKYFVMGDNRAYSFDSRLWENPFVDEENIIGKAWFTFWPLENMRVVR